MPDTAQDGGCVQRDSRGFKMVSSINENPTRLSGSHLMEGFVKGISGIQEPLAQQSLILPSYICTVCFTANQYFTASVS